MDTLKFPLFQKRSDISFKTKFLIAYLVSFQSRWGLVTDLSRKYNISRTYIYALRDVFLHLEKNNFKFIENSESDEVISSLVAILSLRFEGKCCINSISTILKRFGLSLSSIGFISETIKKNGTDIPNELRPDNQSVIKVVFCSDEIFIGRIPILITVEPVSLAILRIELAHNRNGKTWEQHWSSLVSQGYIPLYFAKDEGIGMDTAQKSSFSDTEVQSDTYHAVAHCLGLCLIRLEKSAYKSIQYEYEREELWDKSKTENTLIKRSETYEKAIQATFQAIELYESCKRLYYQLLECFENFDKEGKLKDTKHTIIFFDMTLESIKALKNKEISEKIKSIENCKKNLFYFTRVAKEIIL
jgi:hypothetical protein